LVGQFRLELSVNLAGIRNLHVRPKLQLSIECLIDE
jgi:hypothetical protein